MDSLDHGLNGIEAGEHHLKANVCENDDASEVYVEKDVRFLGRAAQEFEVQAVRSEF